MKRVLIVFGSKLPPALPGQFSLVIAPRSLQQEAERMGSAFAALDGLVGPGSVQEAGALARSLPKLALPDGRPLTSLVSYRGYELWWTHMTDLFLYYCLPYTEYRPLLERAAEYDEIHLYEPPHPALFSRYLEAHKRRVVQGRNRHASAAPTAGIIAQALLTLLSLPFLLVLRRRRMVFTSDKFLSGRDYDFRMQYIYEELRRRKLPFVEFIRSPAPWRTVVAHAWKRRRPVIYTEAVTFLARAVGMLTGGRRRVLRKLALGTMQEYVPMERFKMRIATEYLQNARDDIWAARLMRLILRMVGIRAAVIIAASERNWPTVIGCKLLRIPTVGILHGVNTHHYNMYDFLPGFAGEKMLSVDRYGLWSEWWRQYYLEKSDAYRPEQLVVSGPMRPLENPAVPASARPDAPRILFISEQVAAPAEVLPYLSELAKTYGKALGIKFRPSRDGFEAWLAEHAPELYASLTKVRGTMQEALSGYDVVIGTHSTAVLEALFAYKVPIFFNTDKWGDYFSLREYGAGHPFFAETPGELVERINAAHGISLEAIGSLRERYFGDPTQNGSAWVVNQLEEYLAKRNVS